MIVQLAPIQPHDLRPGDILQHRDGERWVLDQHSFTGSGEQDGWWAYPHPTGYASRVIKHADIERTGPHRLYWLDDCVDRT